MFVHTTCRTCGGPLLLGSGCGPRGPRPKPGWWLDAQPWHPDCPPKMSERDVVDRDLRYSLRQLEKVCGKKMRDTDILAGLIEKWEQRCRELEEQLAGFDAAPPRLLDAAVLYARWGWPVFPLTPGGKKPAISREQGGKGFKDATTDVARIQRYWTKHPMANIGIATGHTFDVVDIDVPKMKDGKMTPDGREIFTKLLEQVSPKDGTGPLPDCYGVNSTPTGGRHILVLPTGEGNRGGLWPGIDIRGIGGYIVAPPSQRPEGRYRWEVAPAPKVRRNA